MHHSLDMFRLTAAIQFRFPDHSTPVRRHRPDDRSPCIYSRIQHGRTERDNHVQILLEYKTVSYFLLSVRYRTISVGLGVFSQIHSNVKDGSSDGAHQFSLWELLLKMEAAQNAFRGAGLIVLNEIHVKSCLFHVFLIVCFHKISAAVAVDGRGDDAESFNTADIFSTVICPISIDLLSQS